MGSVSTLKRYRIWCVTEEAYVYVWSSGEDAPDACPNDSAHAVDTAQAVVVETVSRNETAVSNLPLTPYDRVLCSNESVVIDVKPGVGISRLRDRVLTQGGGTVTSVNGASEYRVAVAGAGDVAELRTLERGPYVSGLCSETGIGGKLTEFPRGDQTVTFGAYDSELGDGFLFEISAAGLSVLAKNDGHECMRTHIFDFNVDCMDGTGPSRLQLDPTRGYVWIVRYTSYGYGQVEFSVAAENIDLQQHIVPLHRYYAKNRPSTACAYLPVSARVEARTQDTPLTIEVTGRKHSVLGDYEPDTRDTSVCRDMRLGDLNRTEDGSANTRARFETVFAIRRRPGVIPVPVKTAALEVCIESQAHGPLMVELVTAIPRSAGTATTATDVDDMWVDVPDVPATETVLQYTESPNIIDGATSNTGSNGSVLVLWRGFVHTIPRIADVSTAVAEGEIMAVRVRLMPTTATAADDSTIAVALRLKECW
jgi:hypothetical protein